MHVSGHACSEELRTLLSLVRPKALMPIHGEYRMLAAHAKLGRDAGIPAAAIVIAENGSVVELTPRGVGIVDRIAPASRSSTGSASATCRTSRSATAGGSPRTAC